MSLSIDEGSFTVIYGPSGCGKSTLLNLLSGLDTHYSGEILFKNTRLATLSQTKMTNFRKNQIGFVFQNFNLIPHMSVLDNILVPMYLNGHSYATNKKKALEYLELVELNDFANKNVTKLSGGQKQRVAIARSLANNPDVIIADEPTGSLDSVSQKNVLDILKRIVASGKTVILVTHNQEVAQYADHIIRMKDGEILEETTERIDNPKCKSEQLVKLNKNKFNLISSMKMAYSNFMDRKWRNMIISLATSIGIAGILISLGLGNGIVKLIQEDMDGGKIPSQIQVAINNEKAAGILNKDDITYLSDKIGKNKIKYIEAPFGISMTSFIMKDLGKINLSDTMPTYSQIVSLYKNTRIKVAANTPSDILAGAEYNSTEEKGITVPESLITEFNEKNNVSLKPEEFLDRSVTIDLVENGSDGAKYGRFDTKIIRVIKDDLEESNSYMGNVELTRLLQENHFKTNIPFILLELKNPDDNEKVIKKITENKKYSAISQKDIMNIVINFIKIIQGLLIVLSLQAILVSVVMISIVLYINIIERTREIGVMKAVGYQNKDINIIFCLEALFITLFSLVISVASSLLIGTIANYVINEKFNNISNVFSLNLQSICYTILLAIGIGILASIVPTLKVGKLDPAESIRCE
ncbi:TPA: ATP-binding cassette domain-containing protein [Enterococcus faecalis]